MSGWAGRMAYESVSLVLDASIGLVFKQGAGASGARNVTGTWPA